MKKLDDAVFQSVLGGTRDSSKDTIERNADPDGDAPAGYSPAACAAAAAGDLPNGTGWAPPSKQLQQQSLHLPGVGDNNAQRPQTNGCGEPATSSTPLSRSTRNGLPAYSTAALPATDPVLPPPPMGGPPRNPSAACSPHGRSLHTSVCLDARTPSRTASSPSKRGAASTPKSAPSPARRHGASGARGASRIDPEQVPRPVHAPEAVSKVGGKEFETNKYQVPPPATAVCTILDRGSCSCEFMRCTTNQVPAYPSTANTAHVPMAVFCQPFAAQTAEEEPVPIVDRGEFGPLRCTRCKAYVCPHFTWHSQGKEACCCLCRQRIEVPHQYFCSLDEKGLRRDYKERPELQRGTVDYVAPADYCDTVPSPPVTVFVVDTSARAVQSGFVAQLVSSIKSLLHFLEGPSSRIALITYDSCLNFYRFGRGAADAQMITVSDIDDPFVPCDAGSLCARADDECVRSQLEELLDRLLTHYGKQTCDQSAGGAALKAATELAGSCGGGHVMMFHATLPNTGMGALRHRDDIRLYASGEMASLYQPQQDVFYKAIAADCNQQCVGVSCFCAPAPNASIDLATLSYVPRKTGGEVMFLPSFNLQRDGERLHYAVSRIVMQGTAYGCVFKLRCSKGLQVENMHATWDAEVIDQSTFNLARLSPDATAVFDINHAERIEGVKFIYLQAACLYTNSAGQRLIRVHTLQLPATMSLSSVFRSTEIDSVSGVLMKVAAAAALDGGTGFKEKITKVCVDVLHAYRISCASTTSTGQLILPESLKMLPLYVGAIRKMPAFRSGSDIRADERVYGLVRMLGLPIAMVAPLIYPRIYTVHPLDARAGTPTGVGDNVYLPCTITASLDKLLPSRMYLVDNGMSIQLYIREEIPAILTEVFGVDSALEVGDALASQAELPEQGAKILDIVEQLRREKYRLPWQPLHVVTAATPEESRLFSMLAEDSVAGEMPYVEFLLHIHRMVQNKLD